MNQALTSYPRTLLVDTLRIVRNYKNALRQVGKRANLCDPRAKDTLIPTVEYAP